MRCTQRYTRCERNRECAGSVYVRRWHAVLHSSESFCACISVLRAVLLPFEPSSPSRISASSSSTVPLARPPERKFDYTSEAFEAYTRRRLRRACLLVNVESLFVPVWPISSARLHPPPSHTRSTSMCTHYQPSSLLSPVPAPVLSPSCMLHPAVTLFAVYIPPPERPRDTGLRECGGVL
ncbi:hypothetical protein C8R44DRAFT_869340 [Mycena epipterygia]|nr:hypothetical protein C8R44DRAFT_869340 [Mycena epipterygia]